MRKTITVAAVAAAALLGSTGVAFAGEDSSDSGDNSTRHACHTDGVTVLGCTEADTDVDVHDLDVDKLLDDVLGDDSQVHLNHLLSGDHND